MIANLPPAFILVFGALLVPLLRGRLQSIYMLLLPVLSLVHLLLLPEGEFGQITLFNYTLTLVRIDKLSMVWGKQSRPRRP